MINLASKKINLCFLITCFVCVIYGLITQVIYGDKTSTILIQFWKNILIAVSIINSSYFIRFLRWRYLISNLGYDIPIKRDFINWIATFAFVATPGRIGELIKINFYKEDFNVPKSQIFSILFFEKISDLLSIIIISFLSLNFVSNFKYDLRIYFLFSLIFLSSYFFKYTPFPKKLIIRFLPNFLDLNISKLYEVVKKVFHFKNLIISLFIGTLGWLLECFSVYILFDSLNNYDINFYQATFAHVTSNLVGALSLIPGGVGATEFTNSNILLRFGVDLDYSIILSFIVRLITIWYGTILGIFIFSLRFMKNKNN